MRVPAPGPIQIALLGEAASAGQASRPECEHLCVGEALLGLHRICADVRFLGSYPRLDGKQPVLPQGLADDDYAAASAWLAGLREGR